MEPSEGGVHTPLLGDQGDGAGPQFRRNQGDDAAGKCKTHVPGTAAPITDLHGFRDRSAAGWALGLVVAYIALGCAYFSVARDSLVERLEDGSPAVPVSPHSLVDALYFTLATLTTVGYGDFHPTQARDRMFVSFFVLSGTAILGYCLGIVMAYLAQLADEDALRTEAGLLASVFKRHRKDETGGAPKRTLLGRLGAKWARLSDLSRRLVKSLFSIAVVLAAGTLLFMYEGWAAGREVTIEEGIYFACVTASTVGYGDFAPQSTAGRLMGALYVVVATVSLAHGLSAIASIPLERRRQHLEEQVLQQYGTGLSTEQLVELLENSESGTFLTRNEFILRMLCHLDRISPQDIAMCRARFDVLDKDGNGRLTREDVLATEHWKHGLRTMKAFFQDHHTRSTCI